MNQKKNSLPTGTLAMSVPVSLCLEPQMTLGTVIQSDHVFVDQLASLSAEQTSGSDSPEKIQDSSRDSTDGSTGNSQCAYMPSEPHGEGDIAVELWKKLEPGEK